MKGGNSIMGTPIVAPRLVAIPGYLGAVASFLPSSG